MERQVEVLYWHQVENGTSISEALYRVETCVQGLSLPLPTYTYIAGVKLIGQEHHFQLQ